MVARGGGGRPGGGTSRWVSGDGRTTEKGDGSASVSMDAVLRAVRRGLGGRRGDGEAQTSSWPPFIGPSVGAKADAVASNGDSMRRPFQGVGRRVGAALRSKWGGEEVWWPFREGRGLGVVAGGGCDRRWRSKEAGRQRWRLCQKLGMTRNWAALLGGLGESLGRFGKEIKRKSKNWLVCQEEMG
jgi:hypothetical protein